jgi:site-specific DNA recombinase
VAKNPIKHIKYKKVKRTSKRPRPKEDWIPFKIQPLFTDRLLFDRVQKILETNRIYAPKNRKHEYLLTGLVFCECGNRRAGDGQNKQGHFYYRCTERIYNFPSLEKKCNLPGVNAVILDGMVWNELIKFVKNPTLLRSKVEEVLRERKEKTANKIENDRLTALINKVEEEEQRYAKGYGAGSLDFEQFKDLMRDAKKRKEQFQSQLNGLTANVQEEDLDKVQVDDICHEANKVLNDIEYTDKTRSIKTLVDKVIIKEGGWVNLCGHIPLFTQKLGDEPASRNYWFT